jgi:hypothetical protein
MQHLRKQFGDKFAQAVACSPTLLLDLQDIRTRHIPIHLVKKDSCQAYSTQHPKAIFIAEKCSLLNKVLYFAHECYHVLRGKAPLNSISIIGISRKQYILLCLREEAACIVHELQVMSELLLHGYRFSDGQKKWYKLYQDGGYKAILEEMKNTETSNSNELYPQYYGRLWDELSLTKLNLQGFHKTTRLGSPPSPLHPLCCRTGNSNHKGIRLRADPAKKVS